MDPILSPLAVGGVLGSLFIISLVVIRFLYLELKEEKSKRLEDWRLNFGLSGQAIKDMITASKANGDSLENILSILQNNMQFKK